MLLIEHQHVQLKIIFILSSITFPLIVNASSTVRACPESTGVCHCNSLKKSVVCARLSGIAQRIPIGIPENTLQLTIQYTNLRRIDVHAFRNCLHLQEINCDKNFLEEISTFAFHQLEYLRNLSLAENSLRFLNENVFSNLHNLQHLNLSHNRLIALAPRNFADLRNLQSLDLRNNPTICIAPDAFSGLHRLEELQLSHLPAHISSKLLGSLTQIIRLSLTSIVGLTNFQEEFLESNVNIKDLNLKYLTSLENKGIPDQFLAKQRHLKTLSFSACNLSRVPSTVLNRVKLSLQALDLSKNPFTCIRKKDLSFLFRLHTLNLKLTGIYRIESGALALPKIQHLDLSGNRLSGLKKLTLGEIVPTKLRTLILGNNPLSCDCDLSWIVKRTPLHFSELPAVCIEPPAMQGFDIRFAIKKHGGLFFPCEVPSIVSFGIQHPGPSKNVTSFTTSNSHVSFSIRCTTSGIPKPTVYWMITRNKSTSFSDDMLPENNVSNEENKFLKQNFCENQHPSHHKDFWKIQENGTLVLNSIPLEKAIGKYTCVAENSAGIIHKSISIKTESNVTREANTSVSQRTQLQKSKNSSLFSHSNRNSSAHKFKSISDLMKYSVITYLTTSKKIRPKTHAKRLSSKNHAFYHQANSTEKQFHNLNEKNNTNLSAYSQPNSSYDYRFFYYNSNNLNNFARPDQEIKMPIPKAAKHTGAARTNYTISVRLLLCVVLLYVSAIIL